MRRTASSLVLATLAAAFSAASLQSAIAACTRLGASVNDYGKDGPTADAKVLLDKYVAKWATDHGIKTYRTGTKEVKCELFLNFIVFDEHTCRAEATVCWDGAPVTPPVTQAAAPGDKPVTAAEKPAASAPTAPVKKVAAPIVKPVATATPAPAAIETGAVPAVPKPVVATPAEKDKTPPATKPTAASADAGVAQQALAAAQRAAEAAERAAAAAERAAASAAAGTAAKP